MQTVDHHGQQPTLSCQTCGTASSSIHSHYQRGLRDLPAIGPDTLKTWLQQHPQLEIISRDRSSEYARAINEGTPQAQQVLDRFLLTNQHLAGCSRWHILKNVREALERFLVRFREPIAEISTAFEATQIPRNKRTKGEQALRDEAHARRVTRFEKVWSTLERGKNIAEITRELHVGKWFVRYCAKTNEVPALRKNPRIHSILDPFVD
jgi:transposase